MGKIIASNNDIVITQEREDTYINDMLKQIVFRHKSMDHVLIISNGDMGVVEYILDKYPKIDRITNIELDTKFLETTKKFFRLSDTLI
jgi:spermidine synthase